MQHLSPLECSRSLDNEVVLAVVDHHVDVPLQKLFDQVDILFHEVLIEMLVDLV